MPRAGRPRIQSVPMRRMPVAHPPMAVEPYGAEKVARLCVRRAVRRNESTVTS
jgi:hypothetical protein